jgi:hypothetical protein
MTLKFTLSDLLAFVRAFGAGLCAPPDAVEIVSVFSPPIPLDPSESAPMIEKEISTDTALPYRVRTLHRGRPVPIDGAPSVEFSDPSVFRVDPDPSAPDDPLTMRFVPLGPLGSTDVTVSVDARPGPETRTLSSVFRLTAIPPEADQITDEFGEPVPLDEGPVPGPGGEPTGPTA